MSEEMNLQDGLVDEIIRLQNAYKMFMEVFSKLAESTLGSINPEVYKRLLFRCISTTGAMGGIIFCFKNPHQIKILASQGIEDEFFQRRPVEESLKALIMTPSDKDLHVLAKNDQIIQNLYFPIDSEVVYVKIHAKEIDQGGILLFDKIHYSGFSQLDQSIVQSCAQIIGGLWRIIDLEDNLRRFAGISKLLHKEYLDVFIRNPELVNSGTLQEKHVTILFTDIAEFTRRCALYGDRETAELIQKFRAEMEKVIYHNKGIINNLIGDAIMVVFGDLYQISNDARRAVRTGMEMIDKIHDINCSIENGGKKIKIRVGIHTGNCQVGFLGKELLQFTAIGDAVNIASRIESYSVSNDPQSHINKVWVSETTKKETESKGSSEFIFRPLPPIEDAHNVDRSLVVYEVEKE